MATERDGHGLHGTPPTGVAVRHANAEATIALATRGVRSSVLRLPPTCHGEGDNGFLPALIGVARAKGVSAYVGDGSNRWPAVHRLDAAHLFRLALEQAPAGSTLHAVDDAGVPFRSIAELIGKHLNLPVESVSPEQATDHFGFLGALAALDSPASADLTRTRLAWQPTRPSLLEDLDAGHYFRTQPA